MSNIALKTRINEDVKTAMRNKDKVLLGTLRLITAAIKQREVDERIELDDAQVLVVLEKMVKQRKDSIEQYRKAGRDDLREVEEAELVVITDYLPEQLPDAEIEALVAEAVTASGATAMKDMGKVMALLKPKLAGRADMSVVSAKIKVKLS